MDLVFDGQGIQGQISTAGARMDADVSVERHFCFEPPVSPVDDPARALRQSDNVWRKDFPDSGIGPNVIAAVRRTFACDMAPCAFLATGVGDHLRTTDDAAAERELRGVSRRWPPERREATSLWTRRPPLRAGLALRYWQPGARDWFAHASPLFCGRAGHANGSVQRRDLCRHIELVGQCIGGDLIADFGFQYGVAAGREDDPLAALVLEHRRVGDCWGHDVVVP
uniref:hypothetical protein n=1 Tax=Palleronia rufa TaxID=1530186 RepID=UPI001F3A18F0